MRLINQKQLCKKSNTNILTVNHKTKEAPAPAILKKEFKNQENKVSSGISIMDDNDDYDWTLTSDMSGNVVSTHFQEETVSVICAALAARFGGSNSDWYAMACGIAGWGATESSVDTWEKVDYYWTPNHDYTSEFPYYIKQVTTSYSDPDCKNYVDTSVRYYYSDMTF